MLIMVAQLAGGFLAIVASFATAFYYVTGIYDGRSIFLLIPAILLVAGGVVLLVKASKNEDKVMFGPPKDIVQEPVTTNDALADKLAKNSQLVAEYNKTQEEKDRLHLLQLATQESDKKPH